MKSTIVIGGVAAAFAAAAPASASNPPSDFASNATPKIKSLAISSAALDRVTGRLDAARAVSVEARVREGGPIWVQFTQKGTTHSGA